MASELAQRGPTWRPDRFVGSQNGTKSGPRRPSMAPKSSPEAQHGSQISPKTSNIAPKSAPKKKAWPPRWPQEAQHGAQVASKSVSRAQYGSLAFVFCMPKVQHGAQETNMAMRINMFPLDLHQVVVYCMHHISYVVGGRVDGHTQPILKLLTI